jgi:hypothetical protein
MARGVVLGPARTPRRSAELSPEVTLVDHIADVARAIDGAGLELA